MRHTSLPTDTVRLGRMSRWILVLVWLGLAAVVRPGWSSPAQWPRTRAERTGYRETSSHADVVAFLEQLRAAGAPISVSTMGASDGGRSIPLVVATRPLTTDPVQAARDCKPVVYVQGNIHAGEVEGKEAMLMLLRDLAQEPAGRGLLDKLVLLTAPIYNIDGNEDLKPQAEHRSQQFGPERVGRRSNGAGLDLNRDYIKLMAPETRGAMEHVFIKWDPDVFLDLHATNGTLHGYQLTYAPPLNPNTEPSILEYTRDRLLPGIRGRLRQRWGMETFDYGNIFVYGRPKPSTDRIAWYAHSPEFRFSTSYVGLRNRIGILSEAMSHLSFRDRVEATYRFVRAILEQVAQEASTVLALTAQADRTVVGWGRDPARAPALGVRFAAASRGREAVLLEDYGDPNRLGRRDPARGPGPPEKVSEIMMPVYDRFVTTETSRYPAGYVLASDLTEVVSLLQRHGVAVERIEGDWETEAETFMVETVKTRPRSYQGRQLCEVQGHFQSERLAVRVGSFWVSTAQPLGILIFSLLEPESIDGVAVWGFLADHLQEGRRYPIWKCYQTPTGRTRSLDSAVESAGCPER